MGETGEIKGPEANALEAVRPRAEAAGKAVQWASGLVINNQADVDASTIVLAGIKEES